MARFQFYICDLDGHILAARQCDASEDEACKLAEALLGEAGPGIGSIEVWLFDRMIRRITRKPG